jgi:hypothetical protein
MMTIRIEDLWASLGREAIESQRRVDESHPLDLYADFEPPDKPGLVLICDERPADALAMQAVRIERRQRQDRRWSVRLILEEPRLLPVFTELCRDIIEFTRRYAGVGSPSGLVLSRIARWRSLLEPQPQALTRSQIRGLIGELLVLEQELLAEMTPDQAVSAWIGPLGASQDFRLPDGIKLEVKAVDRYAESVRINGLEQLDGGGDPLRLVIVRLEDTGADAEGALTARRLVARVRTRLENAPGALRAFDLLLGFAGWVDTADTDSVVVRLDRLEHHEVTDDFPRLTVAEVPSGVIEATYEIQLPVVVRQQ